MRVSRHRVAAAPTAGLLAGLAGLVLGACGGVSSGAGAGATPTTAGENTTFVPSGVATIPRDEIAVMGLGYEAQVRPSTLTIASDGTLRGLRWSGWGTRQVMGTGTLEARICSTSCAAGHVVPYRATVVLSDPVTCENRRYYNVATATITTTKGLRRWGSFLHAPCKPQPLVYH